MATVFKRSHHPTATGDPAWDQTTAQAISCLCCPITSISDDRLLEACHIKPYSHELTNNDEKIDPFNGLMLTPTIHWIFDRGYLSFTDDKRSILSPFLSNMTYSMLGISDDKTYKHLQTKGSEKYLEFHRDNILKR